MIDMHQLQNDFWQFSVDFWQNNQQADVLIETQDLWQADCNILLFLIFLHQKKIILANSEAIFHHSSTYQRQILRPLRQARRGIKNDPSLQASGLYARVKTLEVTVEQEAQKYLCEQAVIKQNNKWQQGHLVNMVKAYFDYLSVIAPDQQAQNLVQNLNL